VSTYYPRASVQLSVLFAGGDGVVRTFFVVPRSVEVERNDHRTADTAEIEIDYADLPIDPRAVESILVRVWMGDATADERSVVDDDRRMFIGYVDDPETVLEEGGEVVRLTCRDYTSIFLDYDWHGDALRLDRPLRRIVEHVATTVPGGGLVPIAFDPPEVAGLVPADVIGRTRWAARAGDDSWTVLADLLSRLSLVPVFELDVLWIRSPIAFAQRSARLVYGANVERLTFTRKSKEIRTKRLRVYALDVATRQVLTAEYPPDPPAKQRVGADGSAITEQAKVMPWLLEEGLWTQADVDHAARQAYQEMAGQYLEGVIETREMVSRFRGQDVDLTRLANGDDIYLRPYPVDRGAYGGLSDGELFAELTAGPVGLRPGIARAVVEAWRRTGDLSPRFYVRQARHTWTRDEGYRLRVEFINRVELTQQGRPA
jgi:hypothetical protein